MLSAPRNGSVEEIRSFILDENQRTRKMELHRCWSYTVILKNIKGVVLVLDFRQKYLSVVLFYLEVWDLMSVSSHSFDVTGCKSDWCWQRNAKASGSPLPGYAALTFRAKSSRNGNDWSSLAHTGWITVGKNCSLFQLMARFLKWILPTLMCLWT